jgi:hypothetical protein
MPVCLERAFNSKTFKYMLCIYFKILGVTMLTQPSRKHKAQSAMEYLMTYGWAILIIAVVLGALFSLGVFNGQNILGTACIASSGYYCQNPTYFHGTLAASPATAGNILVTVGQNTGQTWTTANFVFVPAGTPSTAGVPDISFNGIPSGAPQPANTAYALTGLISGQQVKVYLPNNALVGPATVTLGTSASGAIWAQYTTAGPGSTALYAQVATLNIKAS